MVSSMKLNQLIERVADELIKELKKTNSVFPVEFLPGTCVSKSQVSQKALQDVSTLIDHTLLKPDATREQIMNLCEEAKEYGFASVCVNPTNVRLASTILRNTPVKVCTVIGFPLGANTSIIKAIEARDAMANGASEVDMVINVGALKSGDYDLVKRDIEAVVDAAHGKALVKVILRLLFLQMKRK